MIEFKERRCLFEGKVENVGDALPFHFNLRISSRYLRPPHSSQGRMNWGESSSPFYFSGPLQISHLPPFTLKEKSLGHNPFALTPEETKSSPLFCPKPQGRLRVWIWSFAYRFCVTSIARWKALPLVIRNPGCEEFFCLRQSTLLLPVAIRSV